VTKSIVQDIRGLPLLGIGMVARFFANMPLRIKVGLITILSTFVVCSVTAYVILTSYEKERVTYVFETHQHAVASTAANLNSSVRAKMALLSFEVLKDIPKGLLKVPDSSETIYDIDSVTRENIVYARNKDSDLIKYRLPKSLLLDVLNQSSHQRILVVNQSGVILAASKDKKPQGKTREAISSYLSSGAFVEGTSLLNLNGYRTAVSHLEIKDSNLIVLALTNIDTITQDLLKTVARWLLIALPIFAFSAFFQSAYIGRITAPLYQLIDRFTEISLGNFENKTEISEGEFKPIMIGADKMQRAIREREYRLGLLSMGLRKLMELGQNRRKLNDNLAIAYGVVDAVNPMLSRLKSTPILWVDLGEGKTKQIAINGSQITHGLFTGQDRIKLNGLREVQDAQILYGSDIPFTDVYASEQLHVMVIPFKLELESYGFLILPIKSGLYHKEIDEFANLIFRTVESVFIENKAEELKVGSLILNSELALARAIQEKTISVHGEIKGAEVEWLFNPAQVVGGDLLMIYQYANHNMIDFYLGDVTGHGVDSAFHTSLAAGAIDFYEGQVSRQSSLNEDFRSGKDLSTFSKLLSNLLNNKGSGKLMSLCAGTLFAESGELIFVLAGHPPPLILDANYNLKNVQSQNKVSGLIGEMDFPDQPEIISMKLEKGDTVLIYTDGLLENAVTSAGVALNRKKLSKKVSELLRQRKNGDFVQNQLPKVLMEWTKQEYDAYQLNDDVAVLLIHFS